jgi:hypothetical protein
VKNNLMTAKDVRIIRANFIVIAVTFSEEKSWRHYFRTAPSICLKESWQYKTT